jgi:hypothetical protein
MLTLAAEMENSITIEFRLRGESFDPEQMSNTLGIRCSEFEIGNSGHYTFWILQKSQEGYIDFKELCNELFNVLIPKQGKIIEQIKKYDLKADFTIEFNGRPLTDREVIYGEILVWNTHISSEVVQFLSAIRAPIFFEFQCKNES